MENSKVVKLRNTLKSTGNLPLRVFLNNGHTIIDESLVTQFTIWDDANGILYSFRFIGMQEDRYPNNKHQSVSLFAVDYEEIQAMEIVNLPLDNINGTIDGMVGSGATVSDNFRKRIIHVFKEMLAKDRVNLSPTDINTLVSSARLQDDAPDAVNEKDDYYHGKFTESFQENVQVNRRNQALLKSDEEETDKV